VIKLSEINVEMILSIWELFGDFVPAKERLETANLLIKLFEDNGLDMATIDDILGVDKYLDKAVAEYESDEYADYDDEEDDDYED
jgi:hypothetical protein